jgi:hypothetical protein
LLIKGKKVELEIRDAIEKAIKDHEARMHTGKGKFTPPTHKEVLAYGSELGYEWVDADKFIDSYSTKGWMVGKTKMKDWKAALRNAIRDGWVRVRRKPTPPPQKTWKCEIPEEKLATPEQRAEIREKYKHILKSCDYGFRSNKVKEQKRQMNIRKLEK